MAIYICAGHTNLKGSTYDPGAIGNGYKESELTVRLRDLICKKLDILGGTYKKDSDDWNLNQTINGAGTTEKDIVFDIHFNAATPAATGCETLIPDTHTILEKAYAKEVTDLTCKILGIANRKVKLESSTRHKRLGIMRPKGVNMLWEVCFISNKLDMDKYIKNEDVLATEIAKLLIKADKELN